MQTTTSWEEKGMEKGMERERRSLAKPLEENRPQSPTTRSLHGFGVCQGFCVRAEIKQACALQTQSRIGLKRSSNLESAWSTF
jgi:hypothetical protein